MSLKSGLNPGFILNAILRWINLALNSAGWFDNLSRNRKCTLACRINVGLRLLILRIFLHGYMLVWVATFINFEPWENGKLYRLSCECATSVNKCHYQVSWTKHCYIFLWFWFFLVSFKYVIVNILFCRYFLGYVFLILKTFYMAIIIRQTTFIKFWEVLLGYVY